MTVKEMIDLLQHFNSDDKITLYDISNGERHYVDIDDVDTGIEGVFEINYNDMILDK